MQSFWNSLPKPFSVLAPMEDVTDVAFRRTMLFAGRPDVFFTEFTSIDGLDSRGVEKVAYRLVHDQSERPLVAQVWGKDPEKFYKAAQLVASLGFDGIDINMGCPDKAVLKQGCGAALSVPEHRSLVCEIIQATREGAGALPVSLKTRLGHTKVEAGWIEFLLAQQLAALTVHARTAKEMSLVPARWEEIKKYVEYRNSLGDCQTLIIGNGDIRSTQDARIVDSGVDGFMIGRGVFENPFVFIDGVGSKEKNLQLLRHHLQFWEQYWRNPVGEPKPYKKDYSIMKKFFKMYVKGWEGAAELRAKLMETTEVEEALGLLGSQTL